VSRVKEEMMNYRNEVRFLGAVWLASLLLSSGALAELQGRRSEAASLLVMPEVDSRPGALTLLTVTNTHATEGINAVFVYVDGETCGETVVTEHLTAQDTFTCIAGAHHASGGHGYAYVYAQDPPTDEPVAFDWLTGTCTAINGVFTLKFSVEPFAFQAAVPEGTPTDLDDDDVRDLNGLEYRTAPDRLLFPRFLGQNFDSLSSSLILINLPGAVDFDATVELWIFNDDSEQFVEGHQFRCWVRTPLLSLSGVFDNSYLSNSTFHDPGEIVGLPQWEAGWFYLDGKYAESADQFVYDPAILATLVDSEGSGESAVLPFFSGSQPNGGLIHEGTMLKLPPGKGYCFGDPGSGTPCPCGNDNDGTLLGSGCANGVYSTGARLSGVGVASVTSDSLMLAAVGMEPSNSGLYFQADNDLSPGLTWGDGLRCAGGALKRLGVRFSDASGASDTSGLPLPISVKAGNVSAGDTKYYQCWYRNPAGSPCSHEFNASNGYGVTWAP